MGVPAGLARCGFGVIAIGTAGPRWKGCDRGLRVTPRPQVPDQVRNDGEGAAGHRGPTDTDSKLRCGFGVTAIGTAGPRWKGCDRGLRVTPRP